MTYPNWGRIGSGGTFGQDAVARAQIDTMRAETGDTIPDGDTRFINGKLWKNSTGGTRTIAGVGDAALEALGLAQADSVQIDDHVQSTTDLTGVAPAGAESGTNITTGTGFYVDAGGNWQPKPGANTDVNVAKALGERSTDGRVNVYPNTQNLRDAAIQPNPVVDGGGFGAMLQDGSESVVFIEVGGAYVEQQKSAGTTTSTLYDNQAAFPAATSVTAGTEAYSIADGAKFIAVGATPAATPTTWVQV